MSTFSEKTAKLAAKAAREATKLARKEERVRADAKKKFRDPEKRVHYIMSKLPHLALSSSTGAKTLSLSSPSGRNPYGRAGLKPRRKKKGRRPATGKRPKSTTRRGSALIVADVGMPFAHAPSRKKASKKRARKASKGSVPTVTADQVIAAAQSKALQQWACTGFKRTGCGGGARVTFARGTFVRKRRAA